MKKICVFCGSSSGKNISHLIAAQNLGKILAKRNISLVYGGGNVGIMGELANTVLNYNGEVIGVIPENLVFREAALKEVTELIVVKSMHERKAKMAELSDGFIALPGGIGTLEEFFEIWTWAQLGIHSKPIGMLNVKGYYSGLIEFLKHTVSEEFLKKEIYDLIIFENEPGELIDKMNSFNPPEIKKWIDNSNY